MNTVHKTNGTASVALALTLMFVPVAQASMVTVTATEDTRLEGRSDLQHNVNGSNTLVAVGTDLGNPAEVQRAIVFFDLTGQADPIGDATLSFVVRDLRTFAGQSVSVHLIAAANAGWTDANADWIDLDDSVSTPWTGGGGLGSPGGTGFGTALGTYTFTAGDVAGTTVSWTIPQAVIQGWIDDPSSNAGLLLYETTEGITNDFVFLYSSEAASSSNFPSLSYSVPEPSTFVMMAGALCGLGLIGWRRRR